MHIAAIYDLPDNKDELASVLAAVLETTVYEARSRLRVPGKGPLIIATFKEFDAAEKVVEKLQQAGFNVIVLCHDKIETDSAQFIVRRFTLDDKELVVESGDSQVLTVDYQSIDLILRGTCIMQSTETASVKKRKFSLGRTMLSGGLVISRTEKSTQEVTTEEREGFLHLYSGNRPTLVFRENAVIYDSFGPRCSRPVLRIFHFSYLNCAGDNPALFLTIVC